MKRGSTEMRWSEARLRKVECADEGGMWISLWDVGEVSVANVGSEDASGVDARFFSYF